MSRHLARAVSRVWVDVGHLIFLASNVVRVGGGIAALPLVGKDRDESCQILAAAFQATC